MQAQYFNTGVDSKYLEAVLFPEKAKPARIPSWFSLPSAVFTQKYHFYLPTGSNGAGTITFAPQDITSLACMVSQQPLQQTQQTLNQAGTRILYGQDSTYIGDNYNEVRLVGASISMTYQGQADDASGHFNGATTYNISPWEVSEDTMNYGFNKQENIHPTDGIRMIYYPKTQSDFEFASTGTKFSTSSTTFIPWVQGQPWGYGGWFPYADATSETSSSGGSPYVWIRKSNGAAELTYGNDTLTAPSHHYGILSDVKTRQNPQLLHINWRGLLPNQVDWLRVDVERHFEGIPNANLRDFVSVDTVESCDNAMGYIKKKGRFTEMLSQSVTDFKRMYPIVGPNVSALPFLEHQVLAERRSNVVGMGNVIHKVIGAKEVSDFKRLEFDLSKIEEITGSIHRDVGELKRDGRY